MIYPYDKIISFSLWGNNPTYTIGAIKNAELAQEYFPDWKCVFFIHPDVSKNIQKQLGAISDRIGGVTLVPMYGGGNEPNHLGMFWRWHIITNYDGLKRKAIDMGYEEDEPTMPYYFISRDCDSRLSQKEADEVNAWIESGKTFHSIIAHPYHNIPMLGGLWGCKLSTDLANNWKLWMEEYKQSPLYSNRYQVDQDFLSKFVYPHAKNDMFVSNMLFKQQSPLYSFIGEGFNEHDEPLHPEYREILKSYVGLLRPFCAK